MVKTWNEKVRICVLCLIWYSISSLNNIINKKLLTQFPHPISLSLIHFLSSAVYLGPFLNFWRVPRRPKIPYRTFLQLIVPLGLGRIFGSVSAHITIWKVPVSYAHTGMATSILKSGSRYCVFSSVLSVVPHIGGGSNHGSASFKDSSVVGQNYQRAHQGCS